MKYSNQTTGEIATYSALKTLRIPLLHFYRHSWCAEVSVIKPTLKLYPNGHQSFYYSADQQSNRDDNFIIMTSQATTLKIYKFLAMLGFCCWSNKQILKIECTAVVSTYY